MYKRQVWDRAGNSETVSLNLAVTQDTKAAPEAVLTVTPGAGGAYNKTLDWYTGPKPTVALTLEEGQRSLCGSDILLVCMEWVLEMQE